MATELEYTREQSRMDKVLEEYGSMQGMLFLLPTWGLLTLILFYPMVAHGIPLTLHQYTINPTDVNPWVGLDNFKYWLAGGGQTLFLFSLKMTVIYGLVVVPLDLVFALGAALLMNESLPVRPFWRGLMLAGYAAPPVAAGIAFGTMETAAVYGVIYNIMQQFFSIPEGSGLVGSTPWAFWGVVIAKVWRDFGFMYIVFLAGVQSVPKELYEISKVDGAGPVQRFRHITLPHLRTVIITVVMLRTIGTVARVEIPWATTGGGPGNYTSFLGVIIFKKAFLQWSMGQAAALGVIFALMLMPMILVWIRTEAGGLGGDSG